MVKKDNNKKTNYTNWRLLMLFLAFSLIAITPFLNSHFQFNFIQGWFQSLSIGNLWFVSPLEGIESILTSKKLYGPLIVGMLIPILLAFLLGRVFCSWICPISFFSEILDRLIFFITRKKFRKEKRVLSRKIFWFSLIGELLLTLIIGAPIFVFLSPPGLVGREIMVLTIFHTFAIEGIIIIIVLALHLFDKRFFCKYLCPLGALLSLIGIKRKLVVERYKDECIECGLCKKACPLSLDPQEGESLSPYCWNCGLCIDKCKANALNFKWR